MCSGHVSKICDTVICASQCVQRGGSDWSIKKPCVNRVCPIRKQAKAISQRRFLWQGANQGVTDALTVRSLFDVILNQKAYHRDLRNFENAE